MKAQIKITKFWFPILALSISSLSCSDDKNSNKASPEDLEFAAAVLGSSLANETDGIIAATYDATASVGKGGINYGNGANRKGLGSKSSGGIKGNIDYSYDSETGIHSTSFEFSFTSNIWSKTISILMNHKFTHESGSFVVNPRMNPDSINSVYFTSTRSGSVTVPRKNAEFVRIDTLSIDGIASSVNTLVLNGVHFGSGEMNMTLRDSSKVNKYHTVFVKLTDVSIDKEAVRTNKNLEQGVTGTINYKVIIFNSKNDNEEVIIEGTITMTGDGSALMKFKGFSKQALISLKTGEFNFKD